MNRHLKRYIIRMNHASASVADHAWTSSYCTLLLFHGDAVEKSRKGGDNRYRLIFHDTGAHSRSNNVVIFIVTTDDSLVLIDNLSDDF